jgi:hypothetical protein
MKKVINSWYLCLLIFPHFMFDAAFAATVQLPRTGQAGCLGTSGAVIAYSGKGQDGDKQSGVAAPTPRFSDNSNGTVTDNLTGLIWLKNANCTDTVGSITKASGYLAWANALTWSNNLASGKCGLSDGSVAGQWRLPDRKELLSLVDLSQNRPPFHLAIRLPPSRLFTTGRPVRTPSAQTSPGTCLCSTVT